MRKSIFCTVLSNRRVYQALALISSLDKVTKGKFTMIALCVDEETYSLLKTLKWKNIEYVRDDELGNEITELKKTRKLHEYCWTLKPVMIEYIMDHYPSVKRVTYLDSDLYFWGNPQKIFQPQSECSVLLTKEEKASTFKINGKTSITGNYNSGFLSFNRDESSLSCIKWWKERCLERCEVDFDQGFFGDQHYLDEMPRLFQGVCDITTQGVNIGPWNFRKYRFHVKDEQVYIGKHPLIFFHFSGFRVVRKDKMAFIHNSERNIPFIFKIYKYEILQVIQAVEEVNPHFNGFASEEDLKLFWNM